MAQPPAEPVSADDAYAEDDEVEDVLGAGADIFGRVLVERDEDQEEEAAEDDAVQRQGENDRRGGGKIGEDEEAQGVGGEADREEELTREAFDDQRHEGEDDELGDLADGHQACATDAEDLVDP